MNLGAEKLREARDNAFKQLKENNSLHGDENGRVEIKGDRFNIMGADYFMSDIYQMLVDDYGEEAGTILQTAGVKYGRGLSEMFSEEEGQKQFGSFLGLISFLGYSKPEIKQERIIFDSSPTAEEYRKEEREDRKTCYFLTGMLIGAAMESGNMLKFEETSCKADGDQKCVFHVTSGGE